jgi:hypothetical protein
MFAAKKECQGWCGERGKEGMGRKTGSDEKKNARGRTDRKSDEHAEGRMKRIREADS